jgi:hypothetical protein
MRPDTRAHTVEPAPRALRRSGHERTTVAVMQVDDHEFMAEAAAYLARHTTTPGT